MFDKGQKQSSTLSCDSSYLLQQANLYFFYDNSVYRETEPYIYIYKTLQMLHSKESYKKTLLYAIQFYSIVEMGIIKSLA